MDTYGVERSRAVATSALREAQNRDTVLDRIKLRTGIDLEVIDGPEENRLTYIAVREALRGHLALRSQSTLLVEIGGGSADLSFLRGGQPRHSGTYALGSVRMRQSLASWKGSHEQWVRLLQRHVKNVIEGHPARVAAAQGPALHRARRRRALRGIPDAGQGRARRVLVGRAARRVPALLRGGGPQQR